MTAAIRCEECGKVHSDGDKVAVRSDGYALWVVCETHARWSKRHEIAELMNFVQETCNDD